MDIIQLVFGFVNAPIFATMLLGMFWKRATGIGAFIGLFGGIAGSTVFHAFTTTSSNVDAAGHVINHMKGGYLGVVSKFPSEMAQNFWLAIFAFSICFLATVFISLATRRTKTDEQLKGLVYSLTPKTVDHNLPIWQRPPVIGTVLMIAFMGLEIRWPIGMMFSLIGVLLLIEGAIGGDKELSLGININLIWGTVLLVFGVLMLLGAARGRKTPPSA
jgi:SSS family solute:Na+ symporter